MKSIETIKEEILRNPEENGDREFAMYLGITYDELKTLSYEEEKVFVDMPEGNQNLAGFKITFDEIINPEIIEKIKSNGYDNPMGINAPHYLSFYDELPDEFWEILFEETEEFNDFIAELNGLASLLYEINSLDLSGEHQQILYRQIYIGTFAALENCLCDTLLKLVSTNEQYKINFSRSHPKMKKEKITLSEFYGYEAVVSRKIVEYIKETIFHDFRVVKNMYVGTTGIQFPPINKLYQFLQKRHDLVHRNGRTKDGVKQKLEPKELFNLLEETRMFIIRLLIKTDMFDLNLLKELSAE